MAKKLNWMKMTAINAWTAKSYKHDCAVSEDENGNYEYEATCYNMMKTHSVVPTKEKAIELCEKFVESVSGLVYYWDAYKPKR